MRKREAVIPILVLLTTAVLALSPMVLAFAPSFGFSPNPNTVPGSSETVTVSVPIDSSACPSGDSFVGGITMFTPSSVSSSLTTGIDAKCGSTLTFSYPGDFTGGSTTECGPYHGTFQATTQTGTPINEYATFSVTCPSVPQFSGGSLGLLMLTALLLPMLLITSRRFRRALP